MKKFVEKLRDRRGSVAVEFGLTAPIMFLLIFGLIDFSRAYHTIHDLSAAVREGARFGSTLEDPLADAQLIRDRVKYFAVTFAGETVTDAMIEVEFVDPYQYVTVRIRNYPFDFLALPGGPINVTRQATMRWELAGF